MRILLVSDIHGNPAALDAIAEPFDVCVCLGDLVDYGPLPEPCIAWARENAHHAVRGNHDHGVAQRVTVPVGGMGFRYLTSATRPLSVERLAETDRRYLAGLPLTKAVTLDGRRFLFVHATPRDPMDEYAPPDVDFWTKRLDGLEYDFVCVGHTHLPYVLQVGKTTVINPGSVGLPRDGDWRASYGIVSPNGIELRRVEYDRDRTLEAMQQSPIPEAAKTMLAEVYRTGKLIVPRAAERAKEI